MPGMNDLLQAFGLANQESANYASQGKAILDKQAKAGEDIALDTEQLGKLQGEAAAVRLNGEMRAQDAARSVADSLGANPDNAENFKLAQLGQDFWDAYGQAQQVQKGIVQKQSVGFFDDPLTWLYNQATVDSDISKYNALAQQANSASDAMQQINANVQGTAVAQKAIAQTLTADSIQKSLDANALQAKIEADKIRQQNLSYNLKGLELVHQTSNEGISRQFQLHGALMSEANLAINQEQLVLQRDAAKDRAAARAEALSEKQENQAETQRFTDVVNTARGIQGLPNMSSMEVKLGLKMPAMRAKLEQFYTDGAVALSTGKKVIGETAGQAAATVAINQAPLNPAMKPVRDFATQALQDAKQMVTNPTSKSYKPNAKPEDVMAMTSELIKQRALGYHNDITKNPAGNPYLAPDIKTLAQIPDVANSKFFQVAVAPLAAGGLILPDPDKLIASGLTAMKDGKLSLQDVQIGISGLYKAAVNSNIASRNFQTMHIPVQGGYNASVNNGGAFGSKDRIDLSNPVHVGNFLIRLQLQNTINQSSMIMNAMQ